VGLVLGGALLILGVAILRAFSGDIGRGANRLAVALWRTGAGRLFFRLAAPAKGASAAGAAAPRTSGHAALIALNDLPPALRRQLGDASRVVASLERTVSALDAREGELDRALAEVASAEGGADAAALARDRASLTHDLQRARDGVIAHRDALKSELEHLRLSFVRTRAGVGTAADARASVDRARATVQAAEPQLAPPNGLAVRAPAGSRPA
jgi:ABC-type transporter Mla subunit MlaD